MDYRYFQISKIFFFRTRQTVEKIHFCIKLLFKIKFSFQYFFYLIFKKFRPNIPGNKKTIEIYIQIFAWISSFFVFSHIPEKYVCMEFVIKYLHQNVFYNMWFLIFKCMMMVAFSVDMNVSHGTFAVYFKIVEFNFLTISKLFREFFCWGNVP